MALVPGAAPGPRPALSRRQPRGYRPLPSGDMPQPPPRALSSTGWACGVHVRLGVSRGAHTPSKTPGPKGSAASPTCPRAGGQRLWQGTPWGSTSRLRDPSAPGTLRDVGGGRRHRRLACGHREATGHTSQDRAGAGHAHEAATAWGPRSGKQASPSLPQQWTAQGPRPSAGVLAGGPLSLFPVKENSRDVSQHACPGAREAGVRGGWAPGGAGLAGVWSGGQGPGAGAGQLT